jgi:branched-chain amino acid transport system substrate-binding protein
MPEKAIVERGYKGKIYQTHAAATPDLMRIGGKDVEGTYVVSGPAFVGDTLPDNHPSKKVATDFVTRYDKAYGAGSRSQFAGHAYDFAIVMEKIVPVALKKAKPGTPEFRSALRDAMETMGRTIFAHGVMNWSKDDHWGYTNDTGVMLEVKDGKFVVAK